MVVNQFVYFHSYVFVQKFSFYLGAWRSLMSCQHYILLCCILQNWLLLTNKFIHSFYRIGGPFEILNTPLLLGFVRCNKTLIHDIFRVVIYISSAIQIQRFTFSRNLFPDYFLDWTPSNLRPVDLTAAFIT